MIERVWKFTWTPLWCALGGHDQGSLVMQLEAVIEPGWRYTWRPWSCELGGRDRASLVIHIQAVIEWVWRGTWRPWSCWLAGRKRASLVIHFEAMIERVWRCSCRPWLSEIAAVRGGIDCGGGSLAARCDGHWDSIHWLTRDCGNVENWAQHGLPRDERVVGSRR